MRTRTTQAVEGDEESGLEEHEKEKDKAAEGIWD